MMCTISQRHEDYASHLRSICRELPRLKFLAKTYLRVERYLATCGLYLNTPCTHGNDSGCWLLRVTSPLNDILSHIDVELRESFSQTLCMQSFKKCKQLERNIRANDAYILIHRLLTIHSCIVIVDISESSIHPAILSDAILNNFGVRNVSVSFNKLRENMPYEIMRAISLLQTVECINVNGIEIPPNVTDMFVDMLAQRKIHTLKLSNNRFLLDKALVNLCHDDKLRVLKLHNNLIGIQGLRAIAELLVINKCKLESLSLKYLIGLQMNHIPCSLTFNVSLKRLCIEGSTFVRNDAWSLINALCHNENLETLKLIKCGLDSSTTEPFARLLMMNKSLRKIDVSKNNFDFQSAVLIGNAFRFNSTLRTLNLNKNNFGHNGIMFLILALNENNFITELGFHSTPVDVSLNEFLRLQNVYHRVRFNYNGNQLLGISNSIINNSNGITHLNICNVNEGTIDNDFLRQLFLALRSAVRLESINMELNTHLEQDAAIEFSGVLSTSKTLKKIRLITYTVSSAPALVIMKELGKNRIVTHFDMKFQRNVVTHFIQMLKTNETLEHFGTIRAHVDDFKYIARCIISNISIRSILMDYDPIHTKTINKIRNILRRNTSFINTAVQFVIDPCKFGVRRLPPFLYEQFCVKKSFNVILNNYIKDENIQEVKYRAERYIRANFLAITGISSGVITCFPTDKQESQIDCLNYDCLDKICSYLKIKDIASWPSSRFSLTTPIMT